MFFFGQMKTVMRKHLSKML